MEPTTRKGRKEGTGGGKKKRERKRQNPARISLPREERTRWPTFGRIGAAA